MSQTSARPDEPPTATQRESGLNATRVIQPALVVQARNNWPVRAFQARRFPSQLPVTTVRPSKLNTAQRTLSTCPRRTWSALPLATSQMIAVLSALAETRRVPSLSNATL